jgi:hypothetical protein
MGLASTFQSWLDHKLKIDTYELQGTEIIRGRGKRSEHRLSIEQLESWQLYPEMGFDLVLLNLADGGQLRWINRYDDLYSILRKVAPEKEKKEHTS